MHDNQCGDFDQASDISSLEQKVVKEIKKEDKFMWAQVRIAQRTQKMTKEKTNTKKKTNTKTKQRQLRLQHIWLHQKRGHDIIWKHLRYKTFTDRILFSMSNRKLVDLIR